MVNFENLDSAKGLGPFNKHLADKSYVGGYTLTAEDFEVFGKISEEPSAKFSHVVRWYRHIASYSAEERAQAPSSAAAAAPAAAATGDDGDDSDVDLFASDDEFDEEYEKEVQRRADEAIAKRAAERAAKGKVVIAKSNVVIDVKIEDADTDMEKLEAAIRGIEIDGCEWKASSVIPIGFGISKLRISANIEDEKVSVDDMQEAIEKFEDMVQSTDVHTFTKL